MTLEVSYLFGGNVARNGFFERPFGKRGVSWVVICIHAGSMWSGLLLMLDIDFDFDIVVYVHVFVVFVHVFCC